ncbi:unnamed protein product [Paramecium pentaurelia]|uniref:Uncharacterized protein n=1 Tax=Paramecium pentaurelia TaxID=43138 RepID=A0A8S1SS90_9CILI|nr:unnamed protein product [Paramecium pentaurelia]
MEEIIQMDKIQKKIRRNDDDSFIVQQIVDGNGNDGNLEFNLNKFKTDYVGSKKLKIYDQKEKILNFQQENRKKKLQKRKKKKYKKNNLLNYHKCRNLLQLKNQKLMKLQRKLIIQKYSYLIKIIFDYTLSQIHNENNSQL